MIRRFLVCSIRRLSARTRVPLREGDSMGGPLCLTLASKTDEGVVENQRLSYLDEPTDRASSVAASRLQLV